MEKILLNEFTITSTQPLFDLNTFNADSLALSGLINFSGNAGKVVLLVNAMKGPTNVMDYVEGRYKVFEYESSKADSDGKLPFCEVLDVRPIPALSVVVINNTDGNVVATLIANIKEVIW